MESKTSVKRMVRKTENDVMTSWRRQDFSGGRRLFGTYLGGNPDTFTVSAFWRFMVLIVAEQRKSCILKPRVRNSKAA
jgi:hypothetical protein